jgi:hypothetical protein
MLGCDRLCVTVRLGRWPPPWCSSFDDLSRVSKQPALEQAGSVRKCVERAYAFLCLEVPVLSDVLYFEPDNARAFIAGAIAADVCEPQLTPVFRDDPTGKAGGRPFISALGGPVS